MKPPWFLVETNLYKNISEFLQKEFIWNQSLNEETAVHSAVMLALRNFRKWSTVSQNVRRYLSSKR